MSARDPIDAATDIACGVGNQYGGHVYTGTDRDTIELGIRRLTAAGYRLIGPGELDRETIERCAKIAESYNHWDAEWDDLTPDDAVSRNVTAKSVAAALRALQSQEAGNEG